MTSGRPRPTAADTLPPARPPTPDRAGRLGGRWALTALAYPPAGLAAGAVVGRVDTLGAALVGGGVVAAIVGAAQWWALRPVRPRTGRAFGTWLAATSVGGGAGLALGASVVGFGTGLADLAIVGALTGLVLGPAQALALTALGVLDRRGALVWAGLVPMLWCGGWTVTTLVGVDVEAQYAVFGASGALVAAVAGGAVLRSLVGRSTAVGRGAQAPTPESTA